MDEVRQAEEAINRDLQENEIQREVFQTMAAENLVQEVQRENGGSIEAEEAAHVEIPEVEQLRSIEEGPGLDVASSMDLSKELVAAATTPAALESPTVPMEGVEGHQVALLPSPGLPDIASTPATLGAILGSTPASFRGLSCFDSLSLANKNKSETTV